LSANSPRRVNGQVEQRKNETWRTHF